MGDAGCDLSSAGRGDLLLCIRERGQGSSYTVWPGEGIAIKPWPVDLTAASAGYWEMPRDDRVEGTRSVALSVEWNQAGSERRGDMERKDDGPMDQVWFSGDYRSWEDARRHSTGYEDPRILERVLAATLRVQSGEVAYERDSVTFDHVEYSVPLLAFLLYVASRCRGRLSVMDVGGSLGSSYWQNRRFLEHLEDFSWSVVEQPHFVEAGAAHLEQPALTFFHSMDDCLSRMKPNVALLSSVLPYVAEPYELIGSVLRSRVDFVIVDRTPFFLRDLPDRITIERVPPSIYEATYPAWFFNLRAFCGFIGSSSFELFEEFDSWERWTVDGDAVQCKCLLLIRIGLETTKR